jgi:NAD(P)-dependent dehydrogenase (short-subunit alcohol dehydrogenase family)
MIDLREHAALSVTGEAFLGQNIVVTGCSSGIGRALAAELAARGAQLFATTRNLASVSAMGSWLHAFPADLADEDDLESWIEALLADLPTIDVLIHAAGVFSFGPMASASLEDLDLQYRVNVRAPYRLTQALLPRLRAVNGQVVFLNSSAVRQAKPGWGQYTATKCALTAIADSLRAEENPRVRVLTIYPGRTATPMQERVHRLEERPWQPERLIQPEDVAASIIHALLLPRTAEITDIAIRPMLPA